MRSLRGCLDFKPSDKVQQLHAIMVDASHPWVGAHGQDAPDLKKSKKPMKTNCETLVKDNFHCVDPAPAAPHYEYCYTLSCQQCSHKTQLQRQLSESAMHAWHRAAVADAAWSHMQL
jgi:hypothetical protein